MEETNKRSFGTVVSDSFIKLGNAMSANKHFAAIRDAFAMFIPILMVGSFATLFDSVIFAETSLFADQIAGISGDQ